MLWWVVAGVLLAVAVVVGIATAWQWGVLLLTVFIVVGGLFYVRGTGQDASERWSRALYGSDPDDAHHWSKRK